MKNLNKIFALALTLVPTPVFAQDNPPRITEIGNLLTRAFSYIFPIAGFVCVVFIVLGGYMWISSAGDPDKIKQAQGTLTWAIIGLIFIMVCVAVLEAIKNFIVS